MYVLVLGRNWLLPLKLAWMYYIRYVRNCIDYIGCSGETLEACTGPLAVQYHILYIQYVISHDQTVHFINIMRCLVRIHTWPAPTACSWPGVDADAVYHLILHRNCTNLRYLSIAFCTQFTSKGLHYLYVGKGCKKVTYLDMSGCEQVQSHCQWTCSSTATYTAYGHKDISCMYVPHSHIVTLLCETQSPYGVSLWNLVISQNEL